MIKSKAISIVERHLGKPLSRNINFANASKDNSVYWLDINPESFYEDLNIILCNYNKTKLYYLFIPKNKINLSHLESRTDNDKKQLYINTITFKEERKKLVNFKEFLKETIQVPKEDYIN